MTCHSSSGATWQESVVLETGTSWDGFAEHDARHYGCIFPGSAKASMSEILRSLARAASLFNEPWREDRVELEVGRKAAP
jgi:hypothetical protein